MLACYYSHVHHMAPEAAVRHVRRIRPGSVETPEQEMMVAEFHKAMQEEVQGEVDQEASLGGKQ